MDIPLGTANSELYEKDGEIFYKISPIFGMQLNFFLDAPVQKIRIKGDTLTYGDGFYKLRLEFKEQERAIYKLRIKPTYCWLLPLGITFCEISKSNKEILFNAIKNNS